MVDLSLGTNGKPHIVFTIMGILISFVGLLITILWGLYNLVIVPLHDDIRDMRSDLKIIQQTMIPRPDVDRLMGALDAKIMELNEKIHQMNMDCREHRK